MKTMITLALLFVVGCASASTPVSPSVQFQRDKEQCIYRTTYPRNMHDNQKLAYLRNVAVPACLAAKGYR